MHDHRRIARSKYRFGGKATRDSSTTNIVSFISLISKTMTITMQCFFLTVRVLASKFFCFVGWVTDWALVAPLMAISGA